MQTYRLDELPTKVGQLLGISDWVLVDQERIDQFAHATGDHQWIHVDPIRAVDGPFGGTVAHGFLTLSLLPLMSASAFAISGSHMAVNYGVNRVRFTAPTPVGSLLRAHFTLSGCESRGDGLQISTHVRVERRGTEKPVCLAETVSLRY